MVTIYQLKPKFQALLRPLVQKLAETGCTANGVTLLALLISLGLGALLWMRPFPGLFFLVPLWMLLRMALNAVDGMLAREFGQKSHLGAYLNELSDVVSDAALYLPFCLVKPFDLASVGAVIFLATLSEMAGALGPMIGAERRYEGPMGKSDRAALFGILGLCFGWTGALPEWAFWILPIAAALIGLNVVNRVRAGIAQAKLRSQGLP